MIITNKKNQSTIKKSKGMKSMNPVAAGVVGATVGAGVAVAASVAMKDKKNRERVGKVIDMVKEQATEYIDNIQSPETMNQGKKMVKNVIGKGKKATAKSASR